MARSARVQPRGRTAGERADRDVVLRQLRHARDRRSRPPTASCACGAARASRTWRPGATATLTDGHARLRVGHGIPTTARAPAGLVRLSTTTAAGVEILQDHGSSYAPGRETHHLTLYRDTNGAGPDALVFGAGTIQWSWGLDDIHERGSPAASPAMQQATANLFADMGVQPAIAAGRPAARRRLDRHDRADRHDRPRRRRSASRPGRRRRSTGPRRTPAAAASAPSRSRSTAASAWHPATGREQLELHVDARASGDVTPLARAADDSGNLSGADQTSASGRRLPRPADPAAGSSRDGDGRVRRSARATCASRRAACACHAPEPSGCASSARPAAPTAA